MTEWVNVKCPRCGSPAKRETDTMPQWAGSCWYYIAYCVRENSKFQILSLREISRRETNSKKLKHWLPVDLYVGGAEHAILHLLYARFWHKVLFDIGLLPTTEPFQKLVNQGMILGADGEKMSKSRGNIVSPDELIASYGADSLRMYEMFMGPLEQVKPWDTQGIVGVYRFLNRVWNLCIANQKSPPKADPSLSEKIKNKKQKSKISIKTQLAAGQDVKRLMHKTIKKVTEDIEGMRFNTAIAGLMEFQSALSFQAHILSPRDFYRALDALISLLAPFAPHIAEELWSYRRKFSKRGSTRIKTRIKTRINADVSNNQRKSVSIHEMDWPKYDPRWLKTETITYVIQVNGKLRDTMKVKAGLEESEVVGLAKKQPKVVKWLAGKKITRQVFVKDKLVNFVI
jgi:leucyl-tRNA synthetase